MEVARGELEGEGEGEEGVYCGGDGAAVGDCERAILAGWGGAWLSGRGVEEVEGLTGGQKSSWTSTMIRAGLNGEGVDIRG